MSREIGGQLSPGERSHPCPRQSEDLAKQFKRKEPLVVLVRLTEKPIRPRRFVMQMVRVRPRELVDAACPRPPRLHLYRGRSRSNWDAVTKAIQRASGTTGWHRHDLRRTGATMLGELGETTDIIEAAFNHANIRSPLAATYNRCRYRPQVAKALQRLADKLDEIEAAGPHAAEVKPLAPLEDKGEDGPPASRPAARRSRSPGAQTALALD